MATLPPTATFPRSELELALSEQLFGITSFEVVESTSVEATARVVLLDGTTETISLTTRGYTIKPASAIQDAEVAYESLDELLASISPQYQEAQQRVLMEKLAALQ